MTTRSMVFRVLQYTVSFIFAEYYFMGFIGNLFCECKNSLGIHDTVYSWDINLWKMIDN